LSKFEFGIADPTYGNKIGVTLSERIDEFDNKLMTKTWWKRLRRWWRTAFKTPSTTAEIMAIYAKSPENQEWLAFRHIFLWQRLNLWLRLALICLLTFTLQNVYDSFFPLRELDRLPPAIRKQGLLINFVLFLILVVCFALHKNRFGRHYPGLLFLGSSWSISLSSQLFANLKGFAVPDTFGWSLLFLSQATFMPVRWQLHLLSQLGILGYYLVINTILKVNTILPIYPEIYDITFILYIFWLCTICDISIYLYDRLQRSEFCARHELESAYQKIKVTEAKYRSIFDNAVNGIFQSSLDGNYITANNALAKIYGYLSPEEVIADFTDINHQLYVNPESRAKFLRSITENSGVLASESQIYRRDGSIIWISEKTYVVYDQKGQPLYYEGWIEDITARKQAEEALRVFIHALSHDLRNPVLGNLMVLKNLLSHPGEEISLSRGILARMWQSNDRQLNLINSLMEAHASETQGISLQLQSVQLHQVVSDAIADLQPILAANQTNLLNLVSPDLPRVNCDPTQLWRVFTNLIVNAIKHNVPGLFINIAATVQAENIYCTISDNGLGIDPEKSQHLFDLYYRGNDTRSPVSLGLGLYVCKKIIQAHHGEIGIESATPSGAIFWFLIPISHRE